MILSVKDEDIIKVAKVIFSECGVMKDDYQSHLAVAQCIKDIYEDKILGDIDLDTVLTTAFCDTSEFYDEYSHKAAEDVFRYGIKRFPSSKIYEFRSFKKYSDGLGNPDRSKLKNLYDSYDYLGCDSVSNEWGHFYFGKKTTGGIDLNVIDTFVNNNKNNFREANRGVNDIKYVVVHYTANPSSTAAANAQYYQSGNTGGVSAHYFVDEFGIWRGVREKDIAGHCGKWSNTTYLTDCRNDNSIGVELCCKSMSGMKASQLTGYEDDLYIENQTISNAVTLIKDIMHRYGIKIDHVIRHYDVHSGRKMCPRPFIGDDINRYYHVSGNRKWSEFLGMLTSSNNGSGVPKLPNTPFEVRVIISDLHYRSEPSMNGKILGDTDKGTFTIIETSNGWGKLKSGAGWIWLGNPSYCTVLSESASSEVFKPYSVKVDISDLNIRTGPGTNYAKTGYKTGVGVFTIIEESSGEGSKAGWGRLKSGAGWISLDYATKI